MSRGRDTVRDKIRDPWVTTYSLRMKDERTQVSGHPLLSFVRYSFLLPKSTITHSKFSHFVNPPYKVRLPSLTPRFRMGLPLYWRTQVPWDREYYPILDRDIPSWTLVFVSISWGFPSSLFLVQLYVSLISIICHTQSKWLVLGTETPEDSRI